MAFVKENQKGDTSTVSSTPLSSGPQPSAQPSAPEPSAPTPVTQSASQSEPQRQSSSSAPKSSSSGMFTNIQKYVEKNKPKAQEMAQESRNYVEEANKKAQEASNTAVSGFATQTQASGLHDTENRVNEVTSFTEQESGMNPAPQPAPITAQDDGRNMEGSITSRPEININEPKPAPNPPTIADLDDNQFANIMNARYTGPQSLIETGNLYNDLSAQAKESARIGDLAQNNRNSLLKDIYTTGTNQYNSGQSDLDSYLLGSQEGALKNIMESGKKIGTQQDILRDASNQTISQAKNISEQIGQTRQQAQEAFKTVAGNRQAQIENRVGEVVENWDNLPAHFREAFSSPDGSPNISAIEANIVGVNAGEGLYGMQGDDLFAKKGEEGYIDPVTGQLITTQESGNLQRLQALSNMARTKDKLYNMENSDFADVEQAGTQSAMDALNLGRVREKLAEAEGNFRDFASQNVTGRGSGTASYDQGWFKGKKWLDRNAESTSTLKKVLADQGYDFSSEIPTADASNFNMLKNLANLSNNKIDNGLLPEDARNAMEIGDEVFSGQWGNLIERLGISPSDALALNVAGNVADEVDRFGNQVGGVGGDIISGVGGIGSDIIGGVGNFVDDVGRQLFGGGKGDAKKKAEYLAKVAAAKDLQAKMNDKFKASNFDKRINIDDTTTGDRDKALMNLLAGMDKSNLNEE